MQDAIMWIHVVDVLCASSIIFFADQMTSSLSFAKKLTIVNDKI